MLSQSEITKALHDLAAELAAMDIKGELCLYGGAVLCLAYNARPMTKDVDAVFEPSTKVREAAKKVGEKLNWPADWLNDAVKGWVVPHEKKVFLDLPGLKVFVPEPDYLLAMKTLAARVDASDREDVRFLVKALGLKGPAEVLDILLKYYPKERIKPATQFFVEELFEK